MIILFSLHAANVAEASALCLVGGALPVRLGRGRGEAGGEAGERPGRGRRGTDRGVLGKRQHFPYRLEQGCEVKVFLGLT